MRIRLSTGLLWATLLVTGLFAALNREWFSRIEQVSVGVAVVWLPVGLVLLGVIAGLSGVFLLTLGQRRVAGLVEAKRSSKEVEKARTLAEKAEASRVEELKTWLEAEAAVKAEALARIENAVAELGGGGGHLDSKD